MGFSLWFVADYELNRETEVVHVVYELNQFLWIGALQTPKKRSRVPLKRVCRNPKKQLNSREELWAVLCSPFKM